MSEPKLYFGNKDHITIECPFIKYASECQLNEGAINCDNCKIKKERDA